MARNSSAGPFSRRKVWVLMEDPGREKEEYIRIVDVPDSDLDSHGRTCAEP